MTYQIYCVLFVEIELSKQIARGEASTLPASILSLNPSCQRDAVKDSLLKAFTLTLYRPAVSPSPLVTSSHTPGVTALVLSCRSSKTSVLCSTLAPPDVQRRNAKSDNRSMPRPKHTAWKQCFSTLLTNVTFDNLLLRFFHARQQQVRFCSSSYREYVSNFFFVFFCFTNCVACLDLIGLLFTYNVLVTVKVNPV